MGRPTTAQKLAKRASAKEFLDTLDQTAYWRQYLDDPKTSLEAWKYLNDRVYGKPAQAVDVHQTGDMTHTINRVVLNMPPDPIEE